MGWSGWSGCQWESMDRRTNQDHYRKRQEEGTTPGSKLHPLNSLYFLKQRFSLTSTSWPYCPKTLSLTCHNKQLTRMVCTIFCKHRLLSMMCDIFGPSHGRMFWMLCGRELAQSMSDPAGLFWTVLWLNTVLPYCYIMLPGKHVSQELPTFSKHGATSINWKLFLWSTDENPNISFSPLISWWKY